MAYQDNYTASQPGIQRRILRLKELIQRIDGVHARLLDWQKYVARVVANSVLPATLVCIRGCGSAAAQPPGAARRGIPPVCLPVDELPADARDLAQEHHPHVGHVHGMNTVKLAGNQGISVPTEHSELAGSFIHAGGGRWLRQLPSVRLRRVPGHLDQGAAAHGLPSASKALIHLCSAIR